MNQDRPQTVRCATGGPTLGRRRFLRALGAVPFALACPPVAGRVAQRPSGQNRPGRLLLVAATAGYRHDSIPTALRVLREIASRDGGISVGTVIEDVRDLATLTPATLADHDVLVFANTSGELPLDEQQKSAILELVSGGKGFVGTHSATDTFYGWPAYGDLVGAYFHSHPWVQAASVVTEDLTHPATLGLDPSFRLEEEFYTFRQNPRPRVNVLLRLDAASVGADGDYPVAWWKMYGAGRVYYNALGHFSETWEDSRFQLQLQGALRWAAGLVPAASA